MEFIPPQNKAPNRDSLRAKIVDRESSKPGYKGKVRAFCCHCIYDPYQPGTWLQQIKECTSNDCPLYSVRPLPIGESRESDLL